MNWVREDDLMVHYGLSIDQIRSFYLHHYFHLIARDGVLFYDKKTFDEAVDEVRSPTKKGDPELEENAIS
jgi:hypothetical protein